jgi:hypothetical protein
MKKYILSILFLLITHTAWATTYYIKTGGNDGAAGTSEATAWASLSKINSACSAGNTYLLHKGDTFYGYLAPCSGASGGDTIISAYGTGENPKIITAVKSTSTGDWTDLGSNVWAITNANFADRNDCGIMILGEETSTGKKEQTSGGLNTNGDFWWNTAGTGQIRLYADANPVTKWGAVYLGLPAHGVIIYDGSYITVQNLDIRYAGMHGIYMHGANHINILSNNVRYVGGIDHGIWGVDFGVTRYGNGIELNDSNSNVNIEYNTVSQTFEVGVSIESSATSVTQSNLYVRNNTFDYTENPLTWTLGQASSTASNIYLEYNTATHIGEGWSDAQDQKWNTSVSAAFYTWGDDCTASNIYIRYNNFYGGADLGSDYEGAKYIGFYRAEDISKVVIDYNNYYATDMASDLFAYVVNPSTAYTTSQFASWKAATGQDAHSTLTFDAPPPPPTGTGFTVTGVTATGVTF